MMSKAELARKAGLSTLTIDRVEAGRPCRLDTKRKILLALGLKVSDKDRIFGAIAEAHESRRRPQLEPEPAAVPASSNAPLGAGPSLEPSSDNASPRNASSSNASPGNSPGSSPISEGGWAGSNPGNGDSTR